MFSVFVQYNGHNTYHNGRQPKSGSVFTSGEYVTFGLQPVRHSHSFGVSGRLLFCQGSGPFKTRTRRRLGIIAAGTFGQISNRPVTPVFLIRLGEYSTCLRSTYNITPFSFLLNTYSQHCDFLRFEIFCFMQFYVFATLAVTQFVRDMGFFFFFFKYSHNVFQTQLL